MDVLNGFQQQLITEQAAGSLVIRNLLVKDYPIFVHGDMIRLLRSSGFGRRSRRDPPAKYAHAGRYRRVVGGGEAMAECRGMEGPQAILTSDLTLSLRRVCAIIADIEPLGRSRSSTLGQAAAYFTRTSAVRSVGSSGPAGRKGPHGLGT